MAADELLVETVIEALHGEQADFMLTGSFATNLYGVPRSTEDVDFVVDFRGASVAALARRLPSHCRLDLQTTFETATNTMRNVLTTQGTTFKAELFHLSDDPHDRERFARKLPATICGKAAHVPTVEDVIVFKLRWLESQGRNKDRDDLRNVLSVQGDALDWPYIERWCDVHGTREMLRIVRRAAKVE